MPSQPNREPKPKRTGLIYLACGDELHSVLSRSAAFLGVPLHDWCKQVLTDAAVAVLGESGRILSEREMERQLSGEAERDPWHIATHGRMSDLTDEEREMILAELDRRADELVESR